MSENAQYHTTRESELKKCLLPVGLIAALGFGFYTCTPSQAKKNERIERENAEKKIEERNKLFYTAWNYITPPKNEKRGYSLERGSRVEVLYDIKFERTVRMSQHSLIILFDEKIKFISNNRGKTRDFSKLTDLFLY